MEEKEKLETIENNTNEANNPSEIKFDIMAFYNEIDVVSDDVSNEKLREANKKLPSWSLVPPIGYKK